MTAALTTTSTTTAAAARPRRLGRALGAVALACAATTAVAAAGRAAGISLQVGGSPIPVVGFATATAVCALLGLALAAVLSRTARHPRTALVRATLVLTALSLVPDVVADASPSTRVLLGLTHLVAAAIVIPALARLLPARR